jgi:NAD(P)-dependent dehydrogenase (short-subunit alcohol dehydrogenase family)
VISNSFAGNRIAIITGGAGMLGREHAVALSQDGCVVILIDCEPMKLEEAAREVSSRCAKAEVHIFLCDITSENEVDVTIKRIAARFGQIDILINNAAINHVPGDNVGINSFDNFDVVLWQRECDVGLTGTLLMCKYVGRIMQRQSNGVIVNISSDLSVISPDQRIYQSDDSKESFIKPISYSIIKTGLIGLTRYLSTYWANQGIRVNALSPGGIYDNQSKQFTEKLHNLIPMGRMAEKDEYHEAIRFLCGPGSKYMTGQNLIIDGGRTVW